MSDKKSSQTGYLSGIAGTAHSLMPVYFCKKSSVIVLNYVQYKSYGFVIVCLLVYDCTKFQCALFTAQ